MHCGCHIDRRIVAAVARCDRDPAHLMDDGRRLGEIQREGIGILEARGDEVLEIRPLQVERSGNVVADEEAHTDPLTKGPGRPAERTLWG